MRVTRAALRAQAEGEPHHIHEDEHAAADGLAEPKISTRPVLKDITDANLPEDLPCDDLDELTAFNGKDYKLGNAKTKKTGGTSPEEQGSEPATSVRNNVTESTMETSGVSAADPEDNKQSTEDFQTAGDHPGTPNLKQQASTPININTAAEIITQAARFDPNVHEQPDRSIITSEEDSFLGPIKTRSPAKKSPAEEEQDSFVGQITSRSPSKPVARIEDSVEQLDALEDAIEQIAEELPKLVGPNKGLIRTKTATPKKSTTTLGPRRTPSGRIMSVKPTQSRPSIARTQIKKAVVSPAKAEKNNEGPASRTAGETVASKRKTIAHGKLTTSKPAFVPAKSSKPTTKSTFALPGEAVATRLKAQREARLARMEAKAEQCKLKSDGNATPGAHRLTSFSTKETTPKQVHGTVVKKASGQQPSARRVTSAGKATTVPSFTLPGDAVAAKLKTQREQRAQREVETAAKVFQARLVPSSKQKPSLTPRQNKASHMRLSIANKENIAPRSPVSKSNTVLPNSSARRVTSNIPASHDKINAEKHQPQMTKQEREDAARRARAEAAERGRAASRDWAEKQKKKLAVTVGNVGSMDSVVGM